MNTAPLLLNTRDAAKALATSSRTLWSLTQPRGPIPCVRFGRRSVRYSTAALADWIAQQQKRPAATNGEPSESVPPNVMKGRPAP
jgi:predicted DNA-binding transcriptional regulator AlpA